MIRCLILMLTVHTVVSTVDVNLPEMKYIADHLKSDECRKLVAALHFKSYDAPNVLDIAEKLPEKDVPCLGLLLHWNSGEGEGKGETHQLLFLRLKQIGRQDLADWLAKTVFKQLGVDLHKSMKEPFQEFLNDKENESSEEATDKRPEKKHGKSKPVADSYSFRQDEYSSDWVSFDTICWVIIMILVLITIVLVGRSVLASYTELKNKKTPKTNVKPRHRSYGKYGKYEKMENQPININSETESEDRFDIRRQNDPHQEPDDPALKLMNLRN